MLKTYTSLIDVMICNVILATVFTGGEFDAANTDFLVGKSMPRGILLLVFWCRFKLHPRILQCQKRLRGKCIFADKNS